MITESSRKNRSIHKKGGDVNNIWKMTNFKLISLTAIFLVVFDNLSFFKNVIAIYPVSLNNIVFLISVAVVLTSVIILLFSLFCFKYSTKPVLIIILLASSLASYFMNNYKIVIDDTMIQNVMETDTNEVFDLLNFKLFLYLFSAGILPSIIIYKIKIKYTSFIRELLTRLIVVVAAFLIILASVFSLSDFYSSFFREHKPLRYYTNPTYYIYSIGEYIAKNLNIDEIAITPIGNDAKIPETDTERELIILVVGEAARADRFSINGYHRETNPLLKKEDIITFPDVYSCGTTTSVSVPCMFSIFTRGNYSDSKAESTYNILDILSNAGVNILWRDNNSSSKGVALRVLYEDYKLPENNPICDIECRDEGMLVGLQEYIDSKETGDILIVLHQMGNHGPAYYKRYPTSFEKFKPVCKTNELENCTREEISNTYDNAILYTDYFLSKVIALLKQNPQFEAAMIYISDHGESLGENNLYLHGLPYFMAPETQTHIPAIMWFGDGFKIDKGMVRRNSTKEYSQDNIFHTLLGLMEVETSLYDKDMDIAGCTYDTALNDKMK
jgi:lipid A ethanolaminephosphotransferase